MARQQSPLSIAWGVQCPAESLGDVICPRGYPQHLSGSPAVVFVPHPSFPWMSPGRGAGGAACSSCLRSALRVLGWRQAVQRVSLEGKSSGLWRNKPCLPVSTATPSLLPWLCARRGTCVGRPGVGLGSGGGQSGRVGTFACSCISDLMCVAGVPLSSWLGGAEGRVFPASARMYRPRARQCPFPSTPFTVIPFYRWRNGGLCHARCPDPTVSQARETEVLKLPLAQC